jgi:hypothetical protein
VTYAIIPLGEPENPGLAHLRAIKVIFVLALVAAVPAFAGERTVSEATPAFDWNLYHDRQDACREADRIAAQCTQGHCDDLALRQARRACSAFDRRGGAAWQWKTADEAAG